MQTPTHRAAAAWIGTLVDPATRIDAGIGLKEPIAQPQSRGFAGPIGAQQAQHLTGPTAQVNPSTTRRLANCLTSPHASGTGSFWAFG